jgi:hypothetical protein
MTNEAVLENEPWDGEAETNGSPQLFSAGTTYQVETTTFVKTYAKLDGFSQTL